MRAARCPSCGRYRLVVGRNDPRLRAHARGDGDRCPGSLRVVAAPRPIEELLPPDPA